MLTLLVHTSVVGLVQFCDYVSDILCLVKFKRQGNDESFVAGLTAISLSVAISYALAILGIAGTAQERQQRMGLLLGILILAPLNLHLLWVGYCCSVLLKCGLLPSLQIPPLQPTTHQGLCRRDGRIPPLQSRSVPQAASRAAALRTQRARGRQGARDRR